MKKAVLRELLKARENKEVVVVKHTTGVLEEKKEAKPRKKVKKGE